MGRGDHLSAVVADDGVDGEPPVDDRQAARPEGAAQASPRRLVEGQTFDAAGQRAQAPN